MKYLLKFFSTALATSVLFCSVAQAHVDTIYVKNSALSYARIYVGGTYQGSVEPGATRFCVRKGSTNNDGETIGGWPSTGIVEVIAKTFNERGEIFLSMYKLDSSLGDDARIFVRTMPIRDDANFIGQSKDLSDEDRDNAKPILVRQTPDFKAHKTLGDYCFSVVITLLYKKGLWRRFDLPLPSPFATTAESFLTKGV